MSKTLYSFMLPVAVVLVVGVGVLRLYSDRSETVSKSADRTIVLEAKDGRFLRDGVENPDLTVNAGETVRLVFRNTDTGMNHSFTVPSQTDRLYELAPGEQASVVMQFQTPGQYRYTCPKHKPFMEGNIYVKESIK